MKTLRVCLSNELPGILDRSPDFLYFTYDNLYLYSGQNQLSDNYVIAHEIPEEQVYGLIYILDSDGSVHRKVDYEDKVIAEIESESQIEILKKAGTLFYANAGHRYLDSQRRTLTLPFNDGSYELTGSAIKEDTFDNNTILKFDENEGRFKVFSEGSEEYIDYSKPFHGGKTSTAETIVDGSRLLANVLVSKNADNALKKSTDGLYVHVDNSVDISDFNKWVDSVTDLKQYCQSILDNISAEIKELQDIITPEALLELINQKLQSKYPTIEEALANYESYISSLEILESRVTNYATTNVVNTRNELQNKVEENSNWNELDNSYIEYTHEVNYYEKSKKYYNPIIDEATKKAIIAATINAIILNK